MWWYPKGDGAAGLDSSLLGLVHLYLHASPRVQARAGRSLIEPPHDCVRLSECHGRTKTCSVNLVG